MDSLAQYEWFRMIMFALAVAAIPGSLIMLGLVVSDIIADERKRKRESEQWQQWKEGTDDDNSNAIARTSVPRQD